ncbi:MAG: hypothetical protein J7502_16560, partial [Flavisolibacter sp.]|nr:hypothetical protein [Flavisolibacter sp.]
MQPILRLWASVCSFTVSLWRVVFELCKQLRGKGRRQLTPCIERTITATKVSYTSNDAQATAASFLFKPADKTNSLSTTNTDCCMRSSLLMQKSFAVALTMTCLFFANVVFGQRTASVSGNWNNTATWGGQSVPTASDAITINSGVTVTVDVNNAACLSIVQQNTNGTATLKFNNGSHLTVTNAFTPGNGTNKNFTLDMTSGGILTCGSIVNGGGTFNFTSGSGTIELTSNNILPSIFASFNNLTISSGTTTSSASFSVGSNMTVDGTFAPGNTGHVFSGAGTLTGSGTVKVTLIGTTAFATQFSITNKTLTNLTIDYASSGAQTVSALTYNNLTLSGSGAKTFPSGTTIVNGTLSMQGTATTTLTGTLSYGSSATLEYKGTAAQTTGVEFISPFPGSGGVVINNGNATGVTLGSARNLGANPLTIGSTVA